MDVGQFFNDNVSKKMGVTLWTISILAYLGAHPGYIATVAIIEILVQGWLDRDKPKVEG